jgi:hypothetical protein
MYTRRLDVKAIGSTRLGLYMVRDLRRSIDIISPENNIYCMSRSPSTRTFMTRTSFPHIISYACSYVYVQRLLLLLGRCALPTRRALTKLTNMAAPKSPMNGSTETFFQPSTNISFSRFLFICYFHHVGKPKKVWNLPCMLTIWYIDAPCMHISGGCNFPFIGVSQVQYERPNRAN